MPRPALQGFPIQVTHPAHGTITRIFDVVPNPVLVDGFYPVLGPVFTLSGVPTTASLMSVIVNVVKLPVVLEGAVVTCSDGYVGVVPVTGITPNFL